MKSILPLEVQGLMIRRFSRSHLAKQEQHVALDVAMTLRHQTLNLEVLDEKDWRLSVKRNRHNDNRFTDGEKAPVQWNTSTRDPWITNHWQSNGRTELQNLGFTYKHRKVQVQKNN